MARHSDDHLHRSIYTNAHRLPESFGMHIPANLEGVIIDAGCSHGYTTSSLAEYNPRADVIGIDINEKIIESARARTNQGAKVHFFQGDFYNLEKYFPAESIVAVVAANNLLCISETLPQKKLKRIFASFYTTLAPEGKLYLAFMGRGIVFQKDESHSCFTPHAVHKTTLEDHPEIYIALHSLKR